MGADTFEVEYAEGNATLITFDTADGGKWKVCQRFWQASSGGDGGLKLATSGASWLAIENNGRASRRSVERQVLAKVPAEQLRTFGVWVRARVADRQGPTESAMLHAVGALKDHEGEQLMVQAAAANHAAQALAKLKVMAGAVDTELERLAARERDALEQQAKDVGEAFLAEHKAR